MGIIAGVWDCCYCGATRIHKDIRICPKCGKHIDSNATYYVSYTYNYLPTKKHPSSDNPDWVCSQCRSLNPDYHNICENCGTEREDALNYFEDKWKQSDEEAPSTQNDCSEVGTSNDSIDATESDSVYEGWHYPVVHPSDINDTYQSEADEFVDYVATKYEEQHTSPQTSFKKISIDPIIIKIGAAILAGIVLIVSIIWLFSPKTKIGIITDISWERTYKIEEYATVRESDWYVPPGGRIVYFTEEIRGWHDEIDHYEERVEEVEVIDHWEEEVVGYEDMGNGDFREITNAYPVYRTEYHTYQEPIYVSVPDYDYWYTYDIERWVFKTTISASEHNHSPYWAEYECKNNERIALKYESYNITIVDENDKEYAYSIDENIWCDLRIGQEVKLKTYITGSAELMTE